MEKGTQILALLRPAKPILEMQIINGCGTASATEWALAMTRRCLRASRKR